MKQKLIYTVLLLELCSYGLFAQKTTFGPHCNDAGRYVIVDCSCNPVLRPNPDTAASHRIFALIRDTCGSGLLPDMEERFISDWMLPSDSTMSAQYATRATLRIQYYGTSLPDPTVDVWVFTTLSSQMSDNTILSGMTGSPLFSIDGSNGVVEYSVTSGAFFNSVTDALNAGQLTLAFALPDVPSLHGKVYTIDSATVQLTIEFLDSIAVIITNVVNGINDYDLETESKVRGDQNIFSGDVAEYSHMPAFETPPALRSWIVGKNHIAETWFAKFEDQSLPCRQKFRKWNLTPEDYHVIKYTGPLYGETTQYRAFSDSVVSARHKVKREITHEYDGLSIAYKDSWRVAQSSSPTSQTIQDGYVDQTTPYEPWTDDHSWGVFKNIPFNNSLHYGTHYWRYYQYDQNNDTYARKNDANIDEGDLIHMDEISDGRGTETSPVDGIDVTSIPPGTDPFREYRLEYLDATNTMDFYGVYKAHMLTDKEVQPTRSANQRKIDIDPRGVYHMTYESAGEIWYVNSEDGANWSQEELVSSYIHDAANPSLAVHDSSIYITYIEGDNVLLKRRYKGEWYSYPLDDSDSNNGMETTPVVAVGGTCYPNQGDIVVVVWDDNQYIAYNMLYLYYEGVFINSSGLLVQKKGDIAQNSIHYPVFPTITCQDEQTEFTVCWREGVDIACSEIHVSGGTCDKQKFLQYCLVDSIQNASFSSDSCVFAPSITRDARMCQME